MTLIYKNARFQSYGDEQNLTRLVRKTYRRDSRVPVYMPLNVVNAQVLVLGRLENEEQIHLRLPYMRVEQFRMTDKHVSELSMDEFFKRLETDTCPAIFSEFAWDIIQFKDRGDKLYIAQARLHKVKARDQI